MMLNSEKKNSNIISINDILAKSINEEMKKVGIIIPKSRTKYKRFKSYKNDDTKNFNDYENHMRILEAQIQDEYNKKLQKLKLTEKKNLRIYSNKIAQKRENDFNKIPIYIKGYNKNAIDFFHSKKVFDLEYEKYYKKPSVNLDEVLHNHNQYENNDMRKRDIGLLIYFKNPNLKLDSSKRPTSNYNRL